LIEVFITWIERVRWVVTNNGSSLGETLHGKTLFPVTSSRHGDYPDVSNTRYRKSREIVILDLGRRSSRENHGSVMVLDCR
jgi:hypothetical protein